MKARAWLFWMEKFHKVPIFLLPWHVGNLGMLGTDSFFESMTVALRKEVCMYKFGGHLSLWLRVYQIWRANPC